MGAAVQPISPKRLAYCPVQKGHVMSFFGHGSEENLLTQWYNHPLSCRLIHDLPTWRQCGLLFSGRVSKNLGHTATRTTVGIENATALQQRKKNCELRTAMRRLQDHTMEQWSIRSIRIKRLLELRCVKGFHSTRFLMFRKFYVTANLGLAVRRFPVGPGCYRGYSLCCYLSIPFLRRITKTRR